MNVPKVTLRYSGSKRQMLDGRLGEVILERASTADRFVDLFSGSGVVSHFVATQAPVRVLAFDLQRYAAVLASAVIERTAPADIERLVTGWHSAARGLLAAAAPIWVAPGDRVVDASDVLAARQASESAPDFATRHYGGHYFAPAQSQALSVLIQCLPSDSEAAKLALGALLVAAGRCSASPGHLAQPFRPTPRQLPWIDAAWRRDVFAETRRVVEAWAPLHAAVPGRAEVSDAVAAAAVVRPGDLVFCDPPYADVQYSRLYHVLEGLARGGWDEVSGAGRAPAARKRARSAFSSRRGQGGLGEFARLLDRLANQGAQCVVATIPGHDSGNGLTADAVRRVAERRWKVATFAVTAVRSTLGGTPAGRGTRRQMDEHVVVLRPRPRV